MSPSSTPICYLLTLLNFPIVSHSEHHQLWYVLMLMKLILACCQSKLGYIIDQKSSIWSRSQWKTLMQKRKMRAWDQGEETSCVSGWVRLLCELGCHILCTESLCLLGRTERLVSPVPKRLNKKPKPNIRYMSTRCLFKCPNEMVWIGQVQYKTKNRIGSISSTHSVLPIRELIRTINLHELN